MLNNSSTFKLDLAKISIIISNIIPIIGLIYFDWELINILVYFFIESIVIGFYLLIKVLISNIYEINKEKLEIKKTKESIIYRLFIRDKKVYSYRKIAIVNNVYMIIAVSCFYYIYLYLHIIVLEFIISEVYNAKNINSLYKFLDFITNYISPVQMILPLIILLISHGISLKTKYIKNNEYKNKSTIDFIGLMVNRSLILQGIIILGAFFIIVYDSNIILMILIIFIKTIIDLYTHTKEHEINNSKKDKPI